MYRVHEAIACACACDIIGWKFEVFQEKSYETLKFLGYIMKIDVL